MIVIWLCAYLHARRGKEEGGTELKLYNDWMKMLGKLSVEVIKERMQD